MVTRVFLLAAGLAGAVAAGAMASAAAAPKALAGVAGGLWELEGMPGTKTPVRRCIADPLKLALVEHGDARCTETILSDQGSTVRISYQCGPAGFGQASLKQVTPRAVRVEVSGISQGAPYSYVVQARHIDNCAKGSERGH